MASYARENFSESISSKPVVVADTSTDVHTWSSGVEIVSIYATNVTGADATLTVAIGSVATAGEQICKDVVISPNTTKQIITPEETLTGAATITAISDTASAINLTGSVLRRS